MLTLKECINRAIVRENLEGHSEEKFMIRKIYAGLDSEEKSPVRRRRV